MNLRSLTVWAPFLRKRNDLGLRPAQIHSASRPHNFAFHVVARKQTLTVSAARQQCGRAQVRFPHSPLVNASSKAREDGRLRRTGCESGVSLSRYPRTSVYVKRHLSRIFPCLTRSLASVLIPRPAARHGSASHCVRPCGFRLSENLFGKSPHRTRTKRFSEPSEKAPFGLGSGAHSRRFAQECPE